MRKSARSPLTCALLLALWAIAGARTASADVITFRLDLNVRSVDVNPGDVFDPYVAEHFPLADDLSLLVSWDTDAAAGPGGEFQGALTGVTLEREDYTSNRRAAPAWNYLATRPGDSFGGFADLAPRPGEPMLPFEAYYFEFWTEFAFGTLQPGALPTMLPAEPLRGEFLVALGSGYYENPHFVTGDIQSITAVPEPGTLLVFGTGLVAWGVARIRRRR